MKPIIKNFSGVLENGNRYRIYHETEYIKSLDLFQMHLLVRELTVSFMNVGLKLYIYNSDLSSFVHYKKGEYTKALEKGLLELEQKLKIKLIK